MQNRRAVFELLLISALGLFVELIFIRWVASELRVLAFYKNFALIAAFLGLGLGFALRRRYPERIWFEKYFFPLLAFSVVLVLLLGRTTLSEIILLNRTNAQEFIWAGSVDINDPLLLVLVYYLLSALGLWLMQRKNLAGQSVPSGSLSAED